jgi:hypothetical protein
LKKLETPDDSDVSEPIMSPVKIASQLEEKLTCTPSPASSHKTRLKRQAEQAGLKLQIPKKSGADSTTSEVSDHLGIVIPV